MMWWLLAMLACTGGGDVPTLPAEAEQAREALRAALVERDPQTVGPVARTASAWEGQDADLDILLGDALANVLMRPSEGLPLLQAHPRPDDAEWQRAMIGAALRAEDSVLLAKLHDNFILTDLAMDHPVLEQVGARARRDPTIDYEDLVDIVETCQLLDAQPQRGRQPLDVLVPSTLMRAGRALGAHRVAMGRTPNPADPDPLTGKGPYRCQREAIVLTDDVPDDFPPLVALFAATDGTHSVWMDGRSTDGVPMLIATNDRETAMRWVEASVRLAELLKTSADEQAAAATLSAEFAGGLFAQTETAVPGL